METFKNIINIINFIIGCIAVALLSLLIIDVLAAVFFRYVLKSSLVWSGELARYLSAWVGFLSASLALARREHIGLEILIRQFSPAGQRTAALVGDLVVLVFLLAAVYLGVITAVDRLGQTSATLPISMFWPYLSVPVGSAFMAIQLIYLIIKNLTQPQDGPS